MVESLIEILYPRRCPVCEDVLEFGGSLICNACQAALPYITGPRCFKCGGPVESEEQEYCFGCTKRKHSYSCGYSIFVYNDNMKKAMGDFKFRNRRDNGEFFSRELVKRSEAFIHDFIPDMFIPVPIHRSRLRERGFNQAEQLAESLGEAYGIPVLTGILVRTKDTLPQNKLGSGERLANLKDAFKIADTAAEAVASKRVLVVDDIYTTGSTVEACAQALLRGGAREVGFISVCIGQGY